MPHRYPAEVRYQVIEVARSGTRIAQLAEQQQTLQRQQGHAVEQDLDHGMDMGIG